MICEVILYLFVSDAMQAEGFSCEAGVKEGEISCEWEQRPNKACFEYQLSLSPSSPFAPRQTSGNKTTVGHLKAGATYSISIVSITKNDSSTSTQTTNATASKSSSSDFVFLGSVFSFLSAWHT